MCGDIYNGGSELISIGELSEFSHGSLTNGQGLKAKRAPLKKYGSILKKLSKFPEPQFPQSLK